MKHFYLLWAAALLLIAHSRPAWAQDPQFSQSSFATPLYLNPAFTGLTPSFRASANYRTQWNQLSEAYNTAMFAADVNLADYNSGLGLMAINDRAGTINSTSVTGFYSYKAYFRNNALLTLGLSASFHSYSMGTESLLFRDQLRIDTDQLRATREVFGSLNANFPSFAGGAMYSTDQWWLGLSANYLNRPKQDIVMGTALMPIKWTLHGGLNLLGMNRFNTVTDVGFYPSFILRRQGPSTQLDLGANFSQEEIRDWGVGYILGGWYRGILVQKDLAGNIKQDAISLLAGLTFDKLAITYSFDFTLSKLATYNLGSHEVSLVFELGKGKRARRIGGVANPLYADGVPTKGYRIRAKPGRRR